MLENELKALRTRQEDNISQAYENIINSSRKSYKNELEIILEYFGISYSIKASVLDSQLDEINNRFDINYRFVECDSSEIGALPVLLVGRGENKAVLPAFFKSVEYSNNCKKRVNPKSYADFDGTAICFYKGFGAAAVSKGSLLKYMLKCISLKEYLSVFVGAAVVMTFSMVIPKVQYYIFNHLIPSGTIKDILPISCLLLGLITILLSLSIFKGIVTANIPITVSANLQGAIISRLLSQKISFFDNQRAGALSSSIIKISDTSNVISGKTVSALLGFILSFIYAIQMNLYAKQFMPFVGLSFCAVIMLTAVGTALQKKYASNFTQRLNDMSGFVYELFEGIESIKLSSSETNMFKRWSKFYADCLKAQDKPVFLKYYNAIYTCTMSLISIFIYYTGMRESVDTAEFIAFMSLYGLFLGSIGGISSVLNAYTEFNSNYMQLKDFFEGALEQNSEKRSISSFEGNVEFSKVFYRYQDGADDVLKDISFNIKKGEKVGITGRSGCGKSTLMKLLLGFERPQKGRIFIDNIDLNEVNLHDYRKHLGVVLQNTRLIPADILSNIVLTRPDADLNEVQRVIEIVELKQDIENMPMGLYTFVSDENLTISLGQRQRILLARAIIAQPSLLILDEATNALDNITQAAITRYIENADVTAVMVAHRLSTVRNCDKIIVMDEGRIAEAGNYQELIEKKGVFYELVKRQIT